MFGMAVFLKMSVQNLKKMYNKVVINNSIIREERYEKNNIATAGEKVGCFYYGICDDGYLCWNFYNERSKSI